jgi:hypothetical protein
MPVSTTMAMSVMMMLTMMMTTRRTPIVVLQATQRAHRPATIRMHTAQGTARARGGVKPCVRVAAPPATCLTTTHGHGVQHVLLLLLLEVVERRWG